MGHGIRLTIIATTLAASTAGCIATKEWTRDLFAKRAAEMDNRVVNVEIAVRDQAERLDKVELRVDKVESLTADLQHRSARKIASERAGGVAVRSTTQRILVAVIHVPFGFDRADLGLGAEAALTTIMTEMRNNAPMSIDLEGTTDPAGTRDYNIKLSQRRVEAVKQRLIEEGIEPARIINSTARGPLTDGSVNNDLKRRVVVKLMKLSE